MEFVLLGTGCPQCDPDRLGPATLVRHGGRAVLVDCGSGVTQRLVQAGTPGAAIDAQELRRLVGRAVAVFIGPCRRTDRQVWRSRPHLGA